jgi:hypothetical protein
MITKIANRVLDGEGIPDDWRHSVLVPLYSPSSTKRKRLRKAPTGGSSRTPSTYMLAGVIYCTKAIEIILAKHVNILATLVPKFSNRLLSNMASNMAAE